jgi:fatty-acyl-CoA synthase
VTVPREQTQAKLTLIAQRTLAHTPGQTYTVADRFEERARERGEHPFIVFEGRRISYAQIDALANRVAHAARELGLSRGDAAGLLMENRPEYVACWAGLAKLGVTVGLLNPNARGRALAHALDATSARAVLAGAECAVALDSLPAEARAGLDVRVVPDPGQPAPPAPPFARDFGAALAAASSDPPDAALRAGLTAGEPLFYIFTSGTTGLPKAARLSHMRWLGVGDAMSTLCGYGQGDVIYCVLPLYHGAGGMVVVSSALAQGMTMVLRRRFSASAFWDEVREHGVTGCQYIGEMCRYLMNQPASPRDRDHGLRVMMGAGLGPDLFEEFRHRFGIENVFEGWSSTEANTSLINVDNRPGSCGRIPNASLHNGRLIRYDVDTDTHPRDERGFCIPCREGEVGEFIGAIPDLPGSGAGRFEGYTSKQATEAKILRGVFAPGDAWYRSGDLLRRDADDYYYFVDRIGDTFRWKSENVSTQEVAEALHGFPGVAVANVYGVRVPGMEGRAGMAALVMQDGHAFDPRAFHAHVEGELPRYAAPVFVRIASEADVTSTFKLRKIDLQREGYGAAVADPQYVRDDRLGAYAPLDADSLAAAGYPPFEPEPA